MRVIVFFDLPTLSAEERREYTRFRKFLIQDGFIMVQESVYSKLSLNQNAANALIMKVKHNKPTVGLVQILTVTEKQYANMEMIVGDSQNDIIDSSERMIVL